MYTVMLGAIAMAGAVAGLFFLRFWRDTRDRFFLFFAVAFFIDAINRVVLALDKYSEETEPFFYLVRLLSFVIILAGIADKNRKGR
jgi:uncharacterized membrane protein HdeD (DUF308 family)